MAGRRGRAKAKANAKAVRCDEIRTRYVDTLLPIESSWRREQEKHLIWILPLFLGGPMRMDGSFGQRAFARGFVRT